MRILNSGASLKGVTSRIQRFRENVKGVAAIEFAMIVPLLMMMLIGTLEFGTALTIDRRVSKISSSVADLVSRTDRVNDDDLVFMADKIARSILSPYDYAPTTIHFVQVKADPNNAALTTVDWGESYKNGVAIADKYSNGDSYAMPAGLMSAGTSMIVAEVTYDYTPMIFTKADSSLLTGEDGASPGAYQMEEKFYLSPRTKSCVSLNNTNCVTGNPF